jgi:hypothetical protein
MHVRGLTRRTGWRRFGIEAIVSCLLLSFFLPSPTEGHGGKMEWASWVVKEIPGWRVGAPDESYDRETIFKYMDGSGEVYLSFAFREMLVRQFFREGEPPVTIEVYDMGNSADAFGIFSRNREGADVGIGQGSTTRPGFVMFWKDRFFISVMAERETPASTEALVALGRALADAIAQEGHLPALLSLLPTGDSRSARMEEQSLRYFHRHTDLNQQYFISDDNILGLDDSTDVALARYAEGTAQISLAILHYPDGKSQGTSRARTAYAEFLRAFLRRPLTGPDLRAEGVGQLFVSQMEDSLWSGGVVAGPALAPSAVTGSCLVLVLDAPSRDSAGELLKAAQKLIQGVGR